MERYSQIQPLHTGLRTQILRARAGERWVVLKQLRTPFPSGGELARMRREFDLARAAAGPAVVEMYALHAHEGTAWLEMEDCPGCSLDILCERELPTPQQSVALARRLVAALDHVHRAGIVHRDLNPSNVLVDPDGGLKLIDFGIATTLQPLRVDRLEGTPEYLSPEQTGRMNRPLDWRSDYYSLGATLYYMLTGCPPFSGHDPLELVHAHIAREAVPPRQRNCAVPAALSEIVMTLLAKRADQRYQSSRGLLADLEACLSPQPIVLRSQDRLESLLVPDTLYGRASEIATLEAAVQRVAQGACETWFVTGTSGAGKTALVGEVHRAAARHQALHLSGKFEQFQRDLPYSAVLAAWRGLIEQVQGLEAARLEAWRSILSQALGDTGAVVTEVLPELELLVGKQPPVGEVSAHEAENRFLNTFVRLTAALPQAGPMAVIFLDDLQWADPASLSLLERLMLEPGLQRLLLVGAWRSDEVDAAHPLSRGLGRAQAVGAGHSRLDLEPLGQEDVRALLAQTLGHSPETVSELAQLGHVWTGGNPFLLHRLLDRLLAEALLRLEGGRWSWDLHEISRRGLGEHAADFVAGRLAELPEPTRRALAVASCLGTRFSSSLLAEALQCPASQVATSLAPALALRLIHPDDQEWWADSSGETDFSFAFAHDRIQEAAHAHLSSLDKPGIHVRVGRLLRQRPHGDLFQVVGHLNLACDQLSAEERLSLAGLDAEAGRRALRSGAYSLALQLLEQALALLIPGCAAPPGTPPLQRGGCAAPPGTPPQGWDRELELDAARAAWLAGQSQVMEGHLATALERAASPPERAAALEIRALERAGRDVEEAIEVALLALGELGVCLPPQPSMGDVGAAMGAVMASLTELGLDQVLALPELADPVAALAIRLANSIMAPAYLSRPLLLPILAAQIVGQTVTHGVTPAASYGYAVLSLVLTAGDAFEPGQQIAELCLRLMDRFRGRGQDARPGHVVLGMVLPFTLPLREAMERHRPYLNRALADGDHEYAMWVAHVQQANAFYAGAPLDALAADLEREVQAMRRLGQRAPLDCSEPFRWEVAVLRGESDPQADLGDGSRGAIYVHQTQRLFVSFVLRDLEGAWAAAEAGEAYADGAAVTYHRIVFAQTLALLCLELASRASGEEREALLARAQANRALLTAPAAHAPHNHQHRIELIEAELARVQGHPLAAMDGYDAAIRAAREQGFLHEEALANELAGRFQLARGRLTPARAYLLEACSAWSRWGAVAKLSQLQAELPEIVGRFGPEARRTATLEDVDLDLATLSKATLAITREVQPDRLVERVLSVSMENAGATRGLLLLEEDGVLHLAAAQGGQANPAHTPLAQLTGVPLTILHYVARTSTALVLSDARSDPRFSGDSAICAERPLSVLALPLTSRGRDTGLIYLENDLVADAFPRSRAQLQELLGAQAVTSLENARLYEEMETQVERRTQELNEAREALVVLNQQLEQRVEAQVVEIVKRAQEVEALNVQLQFKVQERSRELAEAMRQLSGPSRLSRGTVVGGRVRVLDLLGKGGMGTVYAGEDLLTGKPVALKLMHPEVASRPAAVQRFLGEAGAAARISHPGVVKTLLLDVSEDGRVFQVMELVEGVDLSQRRGLLPVGAVARIGAGVARALAAAHLAGVVHRDIKPSNIMLSREAPGVRVLDFGIAKILADDGDDLAGTRTTDFVGTPQYCSPDQIDSAGHITAASDVYSLGVVLYELLSGRLPFQALGVAAVLLAHLHKSPPLLTELAPDLPAPLAELVHRCLHKDRAERPSAQALADQLDTLATSLAAPPILEVTAQETDRIANAANASTLIVSQRRYTDKA